MKKISKYPIGTLVYYHHMGFGVVIEVIKGSSKTPTEYLVKWIEKGEVIFYEGDYMETLISNYKWICKVE